jgi:hypothetical protein
MDVQIAGLGSDSPLGAGRGPEGSAENEAISAIENASANGHAPADIDEANRTDERLIEEGEAAAGRFSRSRENILPMARGLAAAKRRYPATQEFGGWLKGSAYSSIGKNDRAALAEIGEYLADHEAIIVEFLARTDLISPQTIRDEIRKMVRPKPTVDSSYYHSKSAGGAGDSGNGKSKAGGTKSNVAPSAGEKPEEPSDPWATGERFDLVLLTPGEGDLKHLRADYADPETLRRCLPLHRVIEDDVAVVVDTRIGDLPVITDNLLPLLGFTPGKRFRVLMVGRPQTPDITDARVLVAIERGVEFSAPEGWLDDHDPVELAQRLYRESSRSLRVFGSTEADGWHCRGWAELPSVR